MNKFDWENFYSTENSTIIGGILNESSIPVDQLIECLCPIPPEFYNANKNLMHLLDKPLSQITHFFASQIKEWEKQTAQRKLPFDDPFKEMLVNVKDKDSFSSSTLLKSDIALTMLLQHKFLPKELKRLPRISEEKLGFKIIPAYYEGYDQKYREAEDKGDFLQFTQIPLNYSNKTPSMFSFKTLQKRWRAKGKGDNEIFKQCMGNKLGAYIKVSEKNVCVSSSFNDTNHLSYFQKGNCGNPHYMIRYKGFERLVVEDPTGFDLINLNHNSLLLKQNHHLLQPLESTDFEKKFSIKRTLKWLDNGKKMIKLEDLFFLLEEIENIERQWKTNPTEIYYEEENEANCNKAAPKREMHELITIFIKFFKAQDYCIIPNKRNEPRRAWNYVKNHLAHKPGSPITEMTQWLNEGAGQITYDSKQKSEPCRLSQKTFQNLFPQFSSYS